jgi:hypothetical protein
MRKRFVCYHSEEYGFKLHYNTLLHEVIKHNSFQCSQKAGCFYLPPKPFVMAGMPMYDFYELLCFAWTMTNKPMYAGDACKNA